MHNLISQLLRPVVATLTSAIGGALVAMGATAHQTDQVIAGITALAAILIAYGLNKKGPK